jgi:hypothetical protein
MDRHSSVKVSINPLIALTMKGARFLAKETSEGQYISEGEFTAARQETNGSAYMNK